MGDSRGKARALIYERVSSDPQRDNYTPAERVQACYKYALEHGHTLVGERWVDAETAYDAAPGTPGAIPAYVDDYTGLKLDRPAFNELLEYARQVGFDVLIVHHIDRLSRDPYDRETAERLLGGLGVEVKYVLGDYAEGAHGRAHKRLDSMVAEMENERRRERTLMGKLGKAKRGLFVAGMAPYGYEIDKRAPGGLRVIPHEAEIVRRVFDMYVHEGISIRAIARRLTEEGVLPPKGGKTWGMSSVRRILRNQAYAGVTYYNMRVVKGKKIQLRDRSEWIEIRVTPVLEEGLFWEAQHRLEHSRDRVRRTPRRFYLLRGLVICDECGKSYGAQTGRAGLNKRKTDAPAYRHRKRHGHCLNRHISARLLDAAVWEKLTGKLLDRETLRKGYMDAAEAQRAAEQRQRAELETLVQATERMHQRIDRLVELYTDPDPRAMMSKEEYLSRREPLDRELRSLEDRIQAVEAALASIPSEDKFEDYLEYVIQVCEGLSDGRILTPEEKRQILEALHVRVYISADWKIRIEGWHGEARPIEGLLNPPSGHCDPPLPRLQAPA